MATLQNTASQDTNPMSRSEKLRLSEGPTAPAAEPHEVVRKRKFADPQADMRRRYLKATKADKAERERLTAAGVPSWRMAEHMAGNPQSMDFARFAALCCGAKNRKGEPCKRRDIYGNGRCINHGGLSTGPKTQAGKLRALANLTGPHEGSSVKRKKAEA
ncbi:HGGxSTG domain-containing protein [Leptothrix cholodnii]|nr:HGGxSTG domain-containing protein [Leptothrix cholodnii]